jgi:MYXO-CTERM domain-containing protein
VPIDGDTIEGEAKVTLHAKVTKAKGMGFHWVHDGTPTKELMIDKDPFEVDLDVDAPDKGESRWRAEVDDGRPRTITSHVWIAAAKPMDTTTETDPTTTTETQTGPGTPKGTAGGCGCALPGEGRATASAALLLLGLAGLASRRRRRA